MKQPKTKPIVIILLALLTILAPTPAPAESSGATATLYSNGTITLTIKTYIKPLSTPDSVRIIAEVEDGTLLKQNISSPPMMHPGRLSLEAHTYKQDDKLSGTLYAEVKGGGPRFLGASRVFMNFTGKDLGETVGSIASMILEGTSSDVEELKGVISRMEDRVDGVKIEVLEAQSYGNSLEAKVRIEAGKNISVRTGILQMVPIDLSTLLLLAIYSPPHDYQLSLTMKPGDPPIYVLEILLAANMAETLRYVAEMNRPPPEALERVAESGVPQARILVKVDEAVATGLEKLASKIELGTGAAIKVSGKDDHTIVLELKNIKIRGADNPLEALITLRDIIEGALRASLGDNVAERFLDMNIRLAPGDDGITWIEPAYTTFRDLDTVEVEYRETLETTLAAVLGLAAIVAILVLAWRLKR
ncbi:MAG: hypothetical protein F7B18_04220 [Desulfurococcales archaeon]|nr:hypothetical protein [Desulfurococcales archaeon]